MGVKLHISRRMETPLQKVDMHETTSTVTIRKQRIDPAQRMLAKELLMAHFPGMLDAGQLIIHFGPGRNPAWVELQQRSDALPRQLREAG